MTKRIEEQARNVLEEAASEYDRSPHEDYQEAVDHHLLRATRHTNDARNNAKIDAHSLVAYHTKMANHHQKVASALENLITQRRVPGK